MTLRREPELPALSPKLHERRADPLMAGLPAARSRDVLSPQAWLDNSHHGATRGAPDAPALLQKETDEHQHLDAA